MENMFYPACHFHHRALEEQPDVPQEVELTLGPLDRVAAATPTPAGMGAYWVFPGTDLRIEEPMSPPADGSTSDLATGFLSLYEEPRPAVIAAIGALEPVRSVKLIRL